MKKLIVFVSLAMLMLIVPAASAAVYDLKADWSDTSNPNGPWTYAAWGTVLSSTIRAGDVWGTPQKSWGEITGWFKSNGTEQFGHDWQAGDIITHSTSWNTPIPSSQILWTAPASGNIDISGGIWHCRNIGRFNDWSILLNGVALTGGRVGSGLPDSRSNPFLFSAGSSGAQAVQNILVNTGDVIELRVTRVGAIDDYAGVTMTITQIPEPATMVLLGLGGVMIRKFKNKS